MNMHNAHHQPAYGHTDTDNVQVKIQPETVTSAPFRALQLTFPSISLWPRLIPKWRGAVIDIAGRDQHIFHNHESESKATLYRPALIQYRCEQGHAVLWGMNEGANALHRWLDNAPETISMNGRDFPLNPVVSRRSNSELEMCDDWRYYHLRDYLALNTDNFKSWASEQRLVRRIAIIEKALTAHVLAFCQAAGWWLPNRLELEIVDLHEHKKTRYHQIDLVSFGLTYRCNLVLPGGIALGKAVSHGFGVQRTISARP